MFLKIGLILASLGQNLAAGQEDFDKQFKEVVEFSRNITYISIIEDIKPRLEKAIASDNNKNKHKSLFLKKLKIDLDFISGLSPDQKQNLTMDMSKFTNSMNAFTSDCFNPELFKQHQLASQSVKKIFKDGSFIDLLISPIPLFALTCLDRKTDHGNLIDAELNRFKKTEWAESPFLDVFYLLYCKNRCNTGDHSGLLDCANQLQRFRALYCSIDDSQSSIDPIGYKIQALSLLKKDRACLDYFAASKKTVMNEPHWAVDCERQFAICASVSDSYFRLGHINESLLYQEMALGKVFSLYQDRDNQQVIETAVSFRDKLCHAKDWVAMRKIEERYKLKALPKQNGEK